MAYIPEAHKKYDLLPRCRKEGGEVFSYSSELESAILDFASKNSHIWPYGFNSYDEFYDYLDYETDNAYAALGDCDRFYTIRQLIAEYKEDIKRRNIKENWSIVQYVGETIENFFTHGRYYYWPCSEDSPTYEGIIDDEEFSSYVAFVGEPNTEYSTNGEVPNEITMYTKNSDDWEIVEDPMGIAYRELFAKPSSKREGCTVKYTHPPDHTVKNIKLKTLQWEDST